MATYMNRPHVTIIGGGFTGLSAALCLIENQIPVTVLEQDEEVGGLASTFTVNGCRLEKFYHYWFTHDLYALQLINKLNLNNNIVIRPNRTGVYYANQIFRLSRPLDVLKFTPLSIIDRIRLGLLVFQVRKIKNWRDLEGYSTREWLVKLCGKNVYKVVWEPLLQGKFGVYADELSAVWLWKKLVLRGRSRDQKGAENFAYYKGGFAALSESIADRIRQLGGIIKLNTKATKLIIDNNQINAIATSQETIPTNFVIATQALPLIADLIDPHTEPSFVARLRRINYLANVCLILDLKHSLSDTYWLNVNDPEFPFVGVIEHTNFEPITSYGGSHIVYLSKYLPLSDPLYQLNNEELYRYAIPYVKKMFPKFNEEWINNYHVWRADYAQPIVEKHYSSLMPSNETPVNNFFIATMAQIYPEDRGTNYAIREGENIAKKIINSIV